MDKHDSRRQIPMNVGDVYCHIANSGVTVGVVDKGFGPTLVINMGAFGNMSQNIAVHVDRAALKKLAELFTKAAEYDDYTEEYDHAARLSRWNFGNGTQKNDKAWQYNLPAANSCEKSTCCEKCEK